VQITEQQKNNRERRALTAPDPSSETYGVCTYHPSVLRPQRIDHLPSPLHDLRHRLSRPCCYFIIRLRYFYMPTLFHSIMITRSRLNDWSCNGYGSYLCQWSGRAIAYREIDSQGTTRMRWGTTCGTSYCTPRAELCLLACFFPCWMDGPVLFPSLPPARTQWHIPLSRAHTHST